MTTLVLQVAGSAIGTLIGGPVGGLLGRAAGALAGAVIDQSLLGGSKARAIEGPRLSEMDGLSSTEGAPIPRVYGRVRVGGQLIWATRFEEVVETSVRRVGGGKSLGGQRVRETSYSYFANIAVALCEGEVDFVRRIWADGREIDLTLYPFRLHRGGMAQAPDPLIVAKEGAGHAPAYPGTAYVVFERLPLAAFGNRVPQLAFEVVRAAPGLRQAIRAVNLIPGSTEFGYAPDLVSRTLGLGRTAAENRNQLLAATDIEASLDQLQALCPNLESVQLVVTWFGNDLRCGACTVTPRVDDAAKLTEPAIWSVAGLTRAGAGAVSMRQGRAAYGGTPSDASVLALIAELRARGLKVVLYPFVMMDVPPGNLLPDPYGAAEQAAYPWRGRIACHPAPGRPGSPDGTPAAAAQVAAFVGGVGPADFTVAAGQVLCAVPGEWSYRRHILHCAHLAVVAGGVDGFVVGSELVGLTRVRSASGVYPFADALVALAADVRSVLGPGTRLTYAADWTEYGAHVREGGAEVRFPLDPLWASAAIDAVGIDYYPPISDWREGLGHLDAGEAETGLDLAYLARRQRAGEAFDWYYASDADRAVQARAPIEDGLAGKPWIFRPKDLAGWWSQPHVERVGGAELPAPTAWIPGSKPVWLTEIGCPAVDKGPNAPNVFPDPKSSEGAVPFFSTGARDDLALVRALTAQIGVFDPASPLFDPAANPLRGGGPGRMIAPADIALWAWDGRPFPAFPALSGVWSDGGNWETGHWLNGRLEGRSLDDLVRGIIADFGLPAPDAIALDGFVDGYLIDRPMSARQAIEPLARLFAFDAVFAGGRLEIRHAARRSPLVLDTDDMVLDREGRPFELRRAQESELPAELRLGHIDGEWDYRRGSALSRRLAGRARRQADVEAPMIVPASTAARLAEERLREAWVARETVTLSLTPRRLDLAPGDLAIVPGLPGDGVVQVTRLADGPVRALEARRFDRNRAPAVRRDPARPPVVPPPVAGAPFPVVVDLPLVRTDPAVLQAVAVSAAPWPGPVAILREDASGGFPLLALAERPALVGRSLGEFPPGPLWRWDRTSELEVELSGGALAAIGGPAALAFGNLLAIRGPDGAWEVFAAADAVLVGPQRYRLSGLLRGLGGSEPLAARSVPAGAAIIALDEALVPLVTDPAEIGRPQRYRIGPAALDAGDARFVALTAAAGPAALLPLSPVHGRARRMPGGVLVSWIRRTRTGGDGWDLAEVPLGEESERYRVEILSGATVLRTAEVAAPEWLYPSAAEIADFGAEQGALSVRIAQIGAAVGPGHALAALLPVR